MAIEKIGRANAIEYPAHMKTLFSITSLLWLVCQAFGTVGPMPGTEDIPKLMAGSTLVCKGEVIKAPAPVRVDSPEGMERMSAVANVKPDRCFKGKPDGAVIPVLFDGFYTGTGGSFILTKGTYSLFFLKPQNDKFVVVDLWFGSLPVSRELGATPDSADSMYLLELDLEAGLHDSNQELVLDSIQMLGNMKHLHSTAALTQMLRTQDLLVKTYLWQALLRLQDFFDSQPELPHELLLPRDQVFEMQQELESGMSGIRDPKALPFLHHFAVTGRDRLLRTSALQALRAIGSRQSAPTYLKALDDPDADNAFYAMQGLLSFVPHVRIEWVPTWKQFDESPRFYASKCREWWETEGRFKAGFSEPSIP
jgi:hypothetical protein